ncbi:hypothetical protein [Lentzea cavernae]|uniref:Uncharacterized protein n=1 Tax=Lentzea cavernae TaxID=2020703 RepID=A0ABQ3MGM5_9PSEU|nr:hypothetical protein [Lentzea cavernae]GHH42690.1 hypothetical protein GCM10017774_39460 [Lentzea cavernae]
MTITVGLGPEAHRTAAAVRDGREATVLGDGVRRYLPHDNRAVTADDVLDWPETPWDNDFADVLRRRISGHLGLAGSVADEDVRLVVSACRPVDVTRVGATELAGAGLVSADQVHPADALLCRWLAARPRAAQSVVVAAVGDAATVVQAYELLGTGPVPRVRRLTHAARADGALPLTRRMAADVLGRLRPGTRVPAQAFADGVADFASRVAAAPDGARVAWTGPFADRLRPPLLVSVDELRSWPEREVIADAVAAVARATDRPAIVLGGPGAVWPLAGRAWRSASPADDLAIGAAWWPKFAARFEAPLDLPETDASPRPAVLPPWQRG